MSNQCTQEGASSSARALPKPWEAPRLAYVGDVAEILQTGTGKVSTSVGDPGEPRKPPSPGSG